MRTYFTRHLVILLSYLNLYDYDIFDLKYYVLDQVQHKLYVYITL